MVFLFIAFACFLTFIMLLMAKKSKNIKEEIITPDGKVYKEPNVIFYICIMVVVLIVIFLAIRSTGPVLGSIISFITIAVPVILRVLGIISYLKFLNFFYYLKKIFKK